MTESCKTIMYHYVRPIKKSKFKNLKGLELSGFNNQINYFQNKFNFINIEKIIDKIYNKKTIPKKSILLTFDDGLKDHYKFVFPILKKFKISGLFFPPVEPIEKKIILDVHKIHFILARASNKKKIVDFILGSIKENKNNFELEDPDKFFKNIAKSNRFDDKETIFIKRALQRDLPEKLRYNLTNELFQKYVTNDENGFSRNLYLSEDEIKEMLENNMDFGSHGYSHYWLSHLDQKELESELKKSKKFLDRINVKKENRTFCYPYGDYNKTIVSKIEEMGYKLAFTTNVSDTFLLKSKKFQLSRFDTNDFPQ